MSVAKTHLEVLTEVERSAAARRFSEEWADRGYEKGDTATFWNELLRTVVGMHDIVTSVRYEERTDARGFIDVTIADAKTIIEQKSLGVSLDKPDVRQGQQVTPFEQARNYANTLPYSQRPRYIIVCNFGQFRIHDLERQRPDQNYLSFTLAELPEQFHLLDFLIDPQRSRQQREERVTMDAGELIATLYRALRQQYIDPDSAASQHSLNVLCVRLVFCLFAEDAGLFGKDAFYSYLHGTPANRIRGRLLELFEVLDTPVDQRDPYLTDDLRSFPYVNGGLFSAKANGAVEIPNFTDEIKDLLLDEVSRDTNWAEISPTIFGGVFESTLNPETRASGGMHYTSPENIHKVIDPLFLDDLKTELAEILAESGVSANKRRKKITAFHDKIAGLTFFDPACGSGNFLTETYISLRRLENKILSELSNQQTFLDVGGESPLKISLDQFYGIEINDFAVSVASTALWIAQLQANIEAQTIVTGVIEDLPLVDAANIHHGNALHKDWSEVIEPAECDYIIGNPPFLGNSKLSAEQKEDRVTIFGKDGGLLDYVACWYKLAADFMAGTTCEAALVSTNSIVQGQQVTPLWKPLFADGISINFAHRTFTWSNEAKDQAHVFCVIIGFSHVERPNKVAWTYRRASAEERAAGAPREIGERHAVEHLNGYLVDAPSVFIERRSKPLSNVPGMAQGFKPADGGNLLLSPEERDELIAAEPGAGKWIRKFSMGQEFINGDDRYCLWLPEITGPELKALPHVRAHIDACREWRLVQTQTGDAYKLADRPHLLRPTSKFKDGTYIGVPKVSSQRRKFIPLGFVDDGMIPGDKLYFIPSDSRYIFGVLMSTFHNAWMRVVGGRLKSDYSYANTIVYNNMVFPDATDAQVTAIESAAQAVIDARELYPGESLADLYDPDNDFLHPELVKAHRTLDRAVEQAYGVDFSALPEAEREQAIVNHLFELYVKETDEA
ncbi:DNA methyltransferase [Corynebacterium tapiri]|uniref:site-specific DNA-methyltransferase (adenine-specific) n=1 Tax=Corynebacterium tapiri TaxID=1448266 RepID=A0A5C4U3C8_9CORY|nr:DNA methyltransferase [Corynebacterium tapiri]TNL94865.1 class I SAM-dependent DNA methyltransferase [Corynebacterium tapiri]